jgi:hypothetical protein
MFQLIHAHITDEFQSHLVILTDHGETVVVFSGRHRPLQLVSEKLNCVQLVRVNHFDMSVKLDEKLVGTCGRDVT